MINYNNIVSFKKYSLIFIEDQYPKNSFYIITKGKAISYGSYFDNSMEYVKGDILGLVNSALNEPYFFNVKAIEDVEALEINVNDIIDIYNKDIIRKINYYLYNSLEVWLSKYYMKLSYRDSIIKYNFIEEYVLDMAKIYIDNDFPTVSYKIYNQYLELFPNGKNVGMVKNLISSMQEYNIEEPVEIDDNIFYYKKGYCLYTELTASNYIYLINSGKIGVYNIVNSKLVTRVIYSNNNIIDGYRPDIDYQALLTTTVVLQDSKIKLLKRKDFMSMIVNVNSLRSYYLKIISTKIRNNILKVMALNTNDISIKLFITIYYILKTEILFTKGINSVDLLYKVNDIATIIGYNNIEIVKNELKKINSISIHDDYIHILNIDNFIKDYNTHKKILISKNYGN